MGGGVFALVNKAIEPLGESRSQLEISDALAPKLGITDYNDKSDEAWLRSFITGLSEEAAFPDCDTLRNQGLYSPALDEPDTVPQKEPPEKEQKPFPTPMGKI